MLLHLRSPNNLAQVYLYFSYFILEQTDENDSSDEDKGKETRITIEQYDPSKTNYPFVREVTLVKTKEGELPTESDLRDFDIQSVSCNGQYVIIHKSHINKSFIFRLSDGLLIGEYYFEVPQDSFRSTYDYANNIIYNISLD